MNRSWERQGVIWPVLLILAGAILLLNNLGRFEWSLWELLFRLWPAILLAAGIELLIPTRNAASYFLTVLLVLAVFVGSFLLMEAADTRTGARSSFDEPLPDAGPTTLILEPVIGAVNLTGGAPNESLIVGSVPAGGQDQLAIDHADRSGRPVVRLSRDFATRGWLTLAFDQQAWDLAANSEVPLELEADMAVGLMDLDLTGLEVGRVDARVGVGEIRLQLPAAPAEIRVDGGVGSLRIELPGNTSVRVEISRGLASLDLPPGYAYVDGVASSPAAGPGTAELQIRVNLGVGLIVIREQGR